MPPADTTLDRPTANPLYRQVADRLANRIYDGTWPSGEAIPTEFALAEEFAVSQGTVRKALTTLEASRLVVRRQGSGTFVGDLGSARSWYHFSRLARPGGERVPPEAHDERRRTRRATRVERTRFKDGTIERVHEIRRVRRADGVRTLSERIVVPEALFPDFDAQPRPLPAALYPYYHQTFGHFVLHVDEEIAAVAAGERVARELELEPGTPLLEIERVARDPSDRVVELRTSQCRSDRLRYRVELD